MHKKFIYILPYDAYMVKSMIRTYSIIILLVALALLMTACTKSVAEVKNDSMIDEKVSVRGVVENGAKIGPFSGYTIRDDTGSIGVVSAEIPKDGARMTVRGTLKKLPLLTVYYIEVG